MKYENVVRGSFISRPNRFIANVDIDGKVDVCHVKNTGRCRELLLPGVEVFLEHSSNAQRRTKYDLIAVKKGKMLINIDSQAPNKVFGEWIRRGDFFKNISLIKPEYTYKNSRFDFYIEADGKRIFAEIKGATLENEGVVLFPDAPTERGVKHLSELIEAKRDGFEAYVFFIIQMKECEYFTPNKETHPEFAKALSMAKEHGVEVYALNSEVTESSLDILNFVPVVLDAP